MISTIVLNAIADGVKHLVEMIQEEHLGEPDVTPNPPIRSIKADSHGTHWCINATVGTYESNHSYRYAIYVDAETGQAETDGY